MKIVAIVLFILTYILLLAIPSKRYLVALISGALFLIIGILPIDKAFFAIDFNVLLMILGTMALVSLFIKSGMPSFLADKIISKSPNVCFAVVALSVFAGIISAFVDNVATVLMVAPVAITVSKKLNVSPVMPVISIAVFSNLQGAATLVGDTTSIMLGGFANMSFADFFIYNGKISMFFIVQISAIIATLLLLIFFRKYKEKIPAVTPEKVTDYFPSILLIAMLGLLIGASFIKNKPSITSGLICVALAVIGIIYDCIKDKNAKNALKVFKDVDFTTLGLLLGLFIVIGGIEEVGIVNDIANALVKLSGDNVFLLYSLIVWGSMIISAFIDNIPYVATMLPVVTGISAALSINPTVLYFGLLAGATLGGNLTPIGASANVTALGILRKDGYTVKTSEFMKLSVPVTLVAVASGYLLVWLFYGM